VSIKINDDFMYLEIDGRVIAVARNEPMAGRSPNWPRFFGRDQATFHEPSVVSWRLAHLVLPILRSAA
jgi:hypothetical protein